MSKEIIKKCRELVIIGDVHGCADELEELVYKCGWNENNIDNNPIIIIVGDLVAKGPKSTEVVQFVKKIGALSVMGNHDHQVVKAAYLNGRLVKEVENGHARMPWLELGKDIVETPNNMKVAAEMPIEDLVYLSNLPLTLRIDEYNLLIVHAGLLDDIAIENQPPGVCMFQRHIITDNDRLKKPIFANKCSTEFIDCGYHWADKWNGSFQVIFGHDAGRGFNIKNNKAVCLDSGCCYGRQLTAIKFPSREIVTVQAKKQYSVQKSKEGVRYAKDNCWINVSQEHNAEDLHLLISAQKKIHKTIK